MMKHAYLILAHDDVPMLSKLVGCIDDARNDIYIHWDRKSGSLPDIHTEHAGLHFTERHDVKWGAFSMVEAEYTLLEDSVARGPYQYYHLLSGADLPIKSQDYVHEFFEMNAGTEFIAFAAASEEELSYRAQHYFIFSDKFKSRNFFIRGMRQAFLKVQDLFHITRNKDLRVRKGSQWFSVTDDFARYVISRKEYVESLFNHTFCPDEMFIQTLCFNSCFYSEVYDTVSEFNGNMRFIKWENGALLDICDADIDSLKSSDRLFARKFSGRNTAVTDNVAIFVS